MKKLADILEDYSLESIQNDFQNNLKLVENFGHLIAENSFPSDIHIEGTGYQLKYRGKLNDVFHLSIRRFFLIKICIKEESFQESLFERSLVLKGKYHLKNIGNGEVEVLSSSPYSKFGNTIRKFTKSEENIAQSDTEFADFSFEEFLKS